MIKEKDIVHEGKHHWVRKVPDGTFIVYRKGPTVSTACATIGYKGQEGLDKAIAEVVRRDNPEVIAKDVEQGVMLTREYEGHSWKWTLESTGKVPSVTKSMDHAPGYSRAMEAYLNECERKLNNEL